MAEEVKKLREMAGRVRKEMTETEAIASGIDDGKANQKIQANNLVATLEEAANDAENLADRIEREERMEEDQQSGGGA